MINKKGSNLIMILSVFVLLISLLFSIVNVTGAWFTDSSADKKTINTVIKTGEANLNVYQEDSTGTQTLLSKSLPTGYTQLEYIESTGTQYIDTGYTANGSTSIDMDFMFTVSKNQALYCSRTSMTSNSFTAFVLPDTIRVDYNNKQITTNLTVKTKTRYRFRNQVDLATLNEKEYNTGVSVSTFTAKPMILFMSYQSYSNGIFSGLGNESCMKLYNFKIYNNGILVRNLVPAKNSSGTIGMYDLVEDKFYTNQGTGTFTAGAEQISGAGVSLAYNTTNKTNNKVTLNDLPAEYTQLKLLLKNEDLGSSFGIRYKVNFYATTLNGKVLLTSSIAGMTAPTSSTNGFVYNSTDGYYYYQNSSGQNVMFEPATSSAVTSKYLMQSFSIDFSSVANLLGGNSIYMEILVESVTI